MIETIRSIASKPKEGGFEWGLLFRLAIFNPRALITQSLSCV